MIVLFRVLHSQQSLDWLWLSGMPEAQGLNPSTRKNEREGQKGSRKKEVERNLGWGEAPGS